MTATYKVHAMYDPDIEGYMVAVAGLSVTSQTCEHIMEITSVVRDMFEQAYPELDYNDVEIDLPKEIEFEVRVTGQ